MIRLKFFSAIAIALLASSVVFAGKGGGGVSSSGGGRPSFGGGSSSTSRPSFGGGSSSNSSSSTSKPSFGGGSSNPSGGFASKPSSGPTFGGGSTTKTTTPVASKTPVSVSKKPVADSFDKLSGTEAKKAESRKAYEKSEAPAASYTAPSGKQVKIDPKNKETEYLRGRLDESHWQSRYTRNDSFYGTYYSRPLVVYNDHFNPYWNYWLMSQSIDVMSMWIYHHQMQMDAARLNAMYAQNAGLQARVAALERQGIARDSTYSPKGVDPDLMYSDEYVNAVYNPKPKTVEEYEYAYETNWSNFWTVMLWLFVYIPLTCIAMYAVFYLVFCRRW